MSPQSELCCISTRTPVVTSHAARAWFSNSFIAWECQILPASSHGHPVRLLADTLGCNAQSLRNAIAATQPGSTVAQHLPDALCNGARRERLRCLLHQSLRTFRHPTNIWSLPLATKVAYAEGIRSRQVTRETLRQALKSRSDCLTNRGNGLV